jgi:alkylation response protein AidB-like acyl-CoA dehydrogenase
VQIWRAPIDDYRLLLLDLLELPRWRELPGYGEVEPELVEEFLRGAARLCEERLLPLNMRGDAEGCRLEAGRVRTPAGFRAAWREFAAGGWLCVAAEPGHGGQHLPGPMAELLAEMMVSANFSFSGYVDLTEGAFAAIRAHGSDAQRARILPRLARGEWAGAMHLTEADAGSDLGLLRSRALPQADGSFRLHGTKQFITAADHDLADNVIGLALARIDGAPPGSAGLSLFVVSNREIGADGTLGERNAVGYTGLEHKMGLRAAATGSLLYDGARAELLGTREQGLRAIFTMVNDTRLGVALQGLGVAEAAGQSALAYARERRQGRAPGHRGGAGPADPIIEHPDVQRMLLAIRSFVDGARALALRVALDIDLGQRHPDAGRRRRAQDRVGLLTPVLKAYFTDTGHECANLALQCFGGYGYMRDTGIEQYLRDVRVTQIYEGTNGIQALDLVGRKLRLREGDVLAEWFAELRDQAAQAEAAGAKRLARGLLQALTRLERATALVERWRSADPLALAAAATDYLRLFALTAMAGAWCELAAVCHRRLADGQGMAEPARYLAKLAAGEAFAAWRLPETALCLERIRQGAARLEALARYL